MDIESDCSFDADNDFDRENDEENLINAGDWNISFMEEKIFWTSNKAKQSSFEPKKCLLLTYLIIFLHVYIIN